MSEGKAAVEEYVLVEVFTGEIVKRFDNPKKANTWGRVFVLVATTLGHDSMTVNAAEVQSVTEEAGEPESNTIEDKDVYKRQIMMNTCLMKGWTKTSV